MFGQRKPHSAKKRRGVVPMPGWSGNVSVETRTVVLREPCVQNICGCRCPLPVEFSRCFKVKHLITEEDFRWPMAKNITSVKVQSFSSQEKLTFAVVLFWGSRHHGVRKEVGFQKYVAMVTCERTALGRS